MIRTLAAVTVVLAGCSEATGPQILGVEVTVSLSQNEVAVGDTVEIRIVATNTTAGEVSFTTNACVLVVQILDQSDTAVVYLPGTCNDIAQGHTLAPGESLAQVVLFVGTGERVVEKPEGGTEYETFPLEPGTYRVFGGISSDLLNPSEAVELRITP